MPLSPRRRRLGAALATLAALAGTSLAGLPGPTSAQAAVTPAPAEGYWMVASDGGVFSFGDAPFHGSTGAVKLNQPIVGMAPTPTPGAEGYWMVATDGGIFSFGDAGFFGSTGAVKLNKPIVGMAPTPSGRGYWMVATDGGIFSFGDAGFFGSTGAVKLNKPIVAMAPTPTGRGYWMLATDGGVFTFGDAGFHGSGQSRAATFAAMAPTPGGKGYWLTTTGGEVLAFGDAAPLGSAETSEPVVGMIASVPGPGYWLVAGDGAVHSFGDAAHFGSTAGVRLNRPMVGFAAAPSAPRAGGPVSTTVAPRPTTTTTTRVTSHGTDAPPETFPPQEAKSGSRTPIATSGTDCGFPSMPQSKSFPDADNIGSGSGMAASTRYPGVYWMIRDGGNPMVALYAVRFGADGTPTSKEIPIPGAVNQDWEEVSYEVGPDGRGRLWVVESGDPTHGGARKIYEIAEPDPDAAASAELLGAYDYALPGDGAGNVVEASMMHRGYLVMVGKVNPHAPVYIFDKLVEGQTNVATYLGTLGNSNSVSMVRYSPDGKMLVTASRQEVHMYRSTDGTGSLLSVMGRLPDCELRAFPNARVESGVWEGNDEMLFLDEGKASYRLQIEP